MLKVNATDVNEALAGGLALMAGDNVEESDSRNGKVRRTTMPVMTQTALPMRRVLFSSSRNANPFFHYMESLWMLSGRNDLPWVAYFNKRMLEYSDDGGATQPSAYGHRWLKHFGYDQILMVVNELKLNPNSRRAVLAMWDGHGDLGLAAAGSADVPCNTHAYFRIVDGALDMTVCCRSNDLWWGAHGANAVHFSILLEYVAAQLDVRVGKMYQLSNDYHMYVDVVKGNIAQMVQDCTMQNLYMGRAKPTQLFYDSVEAKIFIDALPRFMDYADNDKNPVLGEGQWAQRKTPHLERTNSFAIDGLAVPMLKAWDAQKKGQFPKALSLCQDIGVHDNCDWRIACTQWINRKFTRKTGGTPAEKVM